MKTSQSLACLVSILAASTAQAQTADTDEDRVKLPPVTVTAQRRTEAVIEVPVSVSVLDAERLRSIGAAAEDVLVLSARAPSVLAESSFGRTFPRFYIRGLGNTDFDLNASQPVSMVYDDIVLENPTLKGFPIFDLEQVEVLRGPQGTLFGRNTPAGLIKFDSVRPDAGDPGYLRVGFGRFSTLNFEGALNGEFSETSAARVSVLAQRRDDYARNLVLANDERGGFDEYAVRAQWLLSPSDDFEALIGLRARSLEGGSTIFQANLLEQGTGRIRPDYNRRELQQDARAEAEVDTIGLSLRLRWRFERFDLISVTGYESLEMFSRGDVDGGFGAVFAPPFGPGLIPFPAETGDGIPEHRQLSQEFRVESKGNGQFRWQAGLFHLDEDLDIDNISYDTLSGSVINGVARQSQQTRSTAAFGALEYLYSDALTLGAGVRYTDDRKDFVAERLISPIGAGAIGPIRVAPEDDQFTGDLRVSYAPRPDSSLYLRYAQGFRAPSIQGRLLFGDTVSIADSETVDSLELGFKSEFYDGRARLSAALFRYQVDDIQLTAVGGGANFNTLVNARGATGQGLEVDFDTRVNERLDLSLSFSYNDTEIDDPNLAVQRCGAPCTVLDPAGPVAGTVLIDGNPLPNAPEWIVNLAGRYQQPIGGGLGYLEADLSYRSDLNFFLYESVEFRGQELTDLGLRLGYVFADRRHELALVGRNVLDEVVVIGGIDFNNLSAFVNPPRYFGVEYQYRW